MSKSDVSILIKFSEYQAEIAHEGDRSAALISAAWADDALQLYIRKNLATETKVEKELFGSHAPLSTFSSRIRIAFYFGLISRDISDDLHAIRKARNEFAHFREPISFDEAPVRDFISNLKTPHHLKCNANVLLQANRNKYVFSALLIALHCLDAATDDPPFKIDNETFAVTLNRFGETFKEIEDSKRKPRPGDDGHCAT